MAESKEIASKLIAKKLVKELGEKFDFNEYIKDCIKDRQRMIDDFTIKDLKDKYVVGIEKWKTYKDLSDLVMYEIEEFDEHVVAEHIYDY